MIQRLLLLLALSSLSIPQLLAEGEQQFADLGQCHTQSGESIQQCRIGYRTWGKLNPEKTNTVVLLTYFTGNTGSLVGEVGADKYIDPARYFVVSIDAFADGVSSSPSNSKAQPRMKFPRVTIADMVESQHRLLTETLHLDHVHAVMGTSMGGMQSFQWSVQFPDFMDVVIPIVGSTKLTAHDLLLWRGERNAILENKLWNDGNYPAGTRMNAVADLHHLELETPEGLNQKVTPQDFEAKTADAEASETFDPADRVRQLEAMMSHDIATRFNGDMTAAAHAVKSKMTIIVAKYDHMVNPQPATDFAQLLAITPHMLESNCGHLAPGCEEQRVTAIVQQALAASTTSTPQ